MIRMFEGGAKSILITTVLFITLIGVVIYMMRHKAQADATRGAFRAATETTTEGLPRSTRANNVYLKVLVSDEIREDNLAKLATWFAANPGIRRTVVSVVRQRSDYKIIPELTKLPQLRSNVVRLSTSLQLLIVSNYWYSIHERVELDGFVVNGGEKITLEIDTDAHILLYTGTEPISTNKTYSTLCASVNVLDISKTEV